MKNKNRPYSKGLFQTHLLLVREGLQIIGFIQAERGWHKNAAGNYTLRIDTHNFVEPFEDKHSFEMHLGFIAAALTSVHIDNGFGDPELPAAIRRGTPYSVPGQVLLEVSAEEKTRLERAAASSIGIGLLR